MKEPCLPVGYLVVGPIQNNVYLIGNDDGLLVVDPGSNASEILKAIDGRPVAAILLTHCHWDHVGAAAELREATGAPVVASALDAPIISGTQALDPSHTPFTPCPVDQEVTDGELIDIAGHSWRVIGTPGHTPGGICLFLEDSSDSCAPILVAGDTLFAGTHGRTDFEGGSPSAMNDSLRRLAELPDDTVVLPGHNQPTILAQEKPWMLSL